MRIVSEIFYNPPSPVAQSPLKTSAKGVVEVIEFERQIRERWQSILTPREVEAVIKLLRIVHAHTKDGKLPPFVAVDGETAFYCESARAKILQVISDGKVKKPETNTPPEE